MCSKEVFWPPAGFSLPGTFLSVTVSCVISKRPTVKHGHSQSSRRGRVNSNVVIAYDYSRPRQRETVMFWSCHFLKFFSVHWFFRRPWWADFRETLPHDPVFSEIVHLLYGCSYVPLNQFEGQKPQIFADFRTQNRHLEPRHSLIRRKSGNLKR